MRSKDDCNPYNPNIDKEIIVWSFKYLFLQLIFMSSWSTWQLIMDTWESITLKSLDVIYNR